MVSIPDAFDGSLVQMLALLFERGGDDGAGRGTLQLPPEVTSVRFETFIFDEHRDGTGNLQVAIVPLRRAAALAGRRAPSPGNWFSGEVLGPREVGVDRLARLPQVALA